MVLFTTPAGIFCRFHVLVELVAGSMRDSRQMGEAGGDVRE
jgi:hypothetical protein